MNKDKIKICFLINSLGTGGAERTVTYLANDFTSKGYDIDIVIYGDKGIYSLDPKINLFNIYQSKGKKNLFSKGYSIVKRIIEFRKYVKTNNPDVIFCMLYNSVIYTYFVNKVVISSERSNPMYASSFEKKIKNMLFNKANGVIFQTERAKLFYSKKIQNKSIVIPNAVGNMDAYGIDYEGERRKTIVAIGSLKAEKDYKTLINAFSIVHSKHPDYKLEIYGEGLLKNELISLTDNLKLNNCVDFKGKQKDVLHQVKDASCYVLSSISEGMPNALMEAMAIGLPCVSTDCPNGPSELIIDGYNGLLVPIQDSILLSEAICKMIENQDFAEQCSLNAKKIKETNSINNISQRYLNFIEDIVKNKK